MRWEILGVILGKHQMLPECPPKSHEEFFEIMTIMLPNFK